MAEAAPKKLVMAPEVEEPPPPPVDCTGIVALTTGGATVAVMLAAKVDVAALLDNSVSTVDLNCAALKAPPEAVAVTTAA